MRTIVIVTALFVSFVVGGVWGADVPTAKLRLIEEVIELRGSTELDAVRAAQLLETELVAGSGDEEEAAETMARYNLQSEVRLAQVQLYDRLFTEAQLRELAAFYRSDLAQKLQRVSNELPRAVVQNVVAAEAARPKAELNAVKRRRTMAEMRSLATALEARATDEHRYPSAGTIQEIAKLLEPVYIRRAPRFDRWGKPLAFFGTPDGHRYRIVSGGTDGRIEDAHRVPGSPVLDGTDDLVLEDGAFLSPRQ
jgi:hypothetical protein